jgi:hypothetical protein
MKIQFLEAISGPTWGARPGDVLDVEDGEAVRLINARIADPAEAYIATFDVTAHSESVTPIVEITTSEDEPPAPAEEIEVAVVPKQEIAVMPRKPRKSK